ncbi:MAG: hypothetical protein M3Q07_15795, partial [Pseudobdellovibrionaceae bacterium]|nr:hypothetical protein [Pseudobdellovibrionaceae bacterium]
MMSSTKKLFFNSILLTFFGCHAAEKGAETSLLQNNSSDVVQGPSPYQWIEMTEEEAKTVAREIYNVDALQQDAAIVKRLQFWLDRFDDAVRESSPNKLVGVPKPKTMVLKSRTNNAFVHGHTVCYGNVIIELSKAEGATLETNGSECLDAASSQIDLI